MADVAAPFSAAPLTLHETAVRIGRYQWVERALFEVLGGWVNTVGELGVRERLAVHSHHHAEHAERWQALLPRVHDLDAEALVGPAPGMGALVAALVETTGADRTIEKLVGAYRVLIPRAIAAYTDHLRHASPVADPPVVRELRLALDDALDHWRDGEVLLQPLLASGDDVDRAAAHQARLEKHLVLPRRT